MPKLVEQNKCCGCAACVNKCAKGAIVMKPNEEGFLHPAIDSTLCVECRACEKVCPGLEMKCNYKLPPPSGFAESLYHSA